ncbi:MAG: polysaccharide deacetylase family protein [Chitinispirillaceae bacterium]|nr:polysaccharide deacetylase family protein [Chitinispirillaceae bacterium]
MTPKILLRAMIAQLRMSTGMFHFQLQKRAKKGQSVILMYHRVVDPSKTDEFIEPGMYVTPKTFKMHLKLLAGYFDVISLQHLFERSATSSKKPQCAITFDDGWLDFYTNAYPLLQETKTPATVFLPTDFIGTKQWFWTDRLASILKKSKVSPAQPASNSIVSQISQLSGSLYSRIDAALKLLKPHSLETIGKVLGELEILYCNGSNTIQKRAFLDWYDCRTLKNSGHVTFGSHTAQHSILTSENERRCKEELEISRKKLLDEDVVNRSFIPFCYPNGGFSQECARIVEKTGYHCAVTTKMGWTDSTSNRFTLNRVGLHQDITSTPALLLARINK